VNVIGNNGWVARLEPEDPLAVQDYRAMFRLLEDVAGAVDLAGFRTQLQEAFARRLGWTGVSVLAGFTPEQTAAGRPGADQFGQRYAEEYRGRWWSIDPLATPGGVRTMVRRGVATVRELAADGSPEQRAYLDTYLHRYGVTDMLGTLIDAGAAGDAFLGVPLRGDRPAGARERHIVHRLRRQLAVPFALHLSNARPPAQSYGLTAREREVAELVGQGLTNEQVAARLFIGVDTVKKHFSRVLAKTGCSRRAQFVTRWRAGPS
jgi:DNA-binding CsgD family transcriptional regulator